jgi:hypothetical protein
VTSPASWLVPLAGALWAAWHLHRSYFFYDEWSMIDRVLHEPPLAGTMASFNGHLWMLQYWIYRAQVTWFGVDDHVFVAAVFVVALVVLHVSLAMLLRVSGLSPVSSTLLAGLLTYLGAASQNFLFAVQLSPALSLAAGAAASALALAGPPTGRRAVAVGSLALLAVALDSGMALVSVTLASVVTVLAWPGRARLAVVPGLLAVAFWAIVGSHGPAFPASLDVRAQFAGELLLHAAGALIGRGSRTGAVLLAIAVILVVSVLRRGEADARGRIMLVAGGAATTVVVAALAAARAGYPGIDLVLFNRYLQDVAIPLTVAVAPIVAIGGRRLVRAVWPAAGPRTATAAGAVLLAGAFACGLAPKRAYHSGFERMNVATRDGVASAAMVVRDGCPSGRPPDAASQPLGEIGPQISTRLIRELVERGMLSAPVGRRPDPAIVARMCARP